MIDYTLNRAQADELFDQNAVMLGEHGNVVFDYKIAEIFGETVFTWAELAMHSKSAYIKFRDDWNRWGDCGCDFFSRSGFLKIVSQHNYLVSMEQRRASEGGKLCEALREAREKERDAEEERKYQERRAKAKAAREARAAKKAQKEVTSA